MLPPPLPSRQNGVATLMLTIVVLMIMTLTTLYTARVVITDDKIFANHYRNMQALDAAHSGFDYALAYLNENPSTVTTALSSCAVGNETYSLTSGTLANNATYTMAYGCVSAGSTTYLTITAVGTAADGSAIRTINGTVKLTNVSFLGYPVIGRVDNAGTNSIDIQDSSLVTNIEASANTSMAGGGTVRLRNSASTVTTAGSPYTCAAAITMPPAPAPTTCQDISFSNGSLSSMSTSSFQTQFLGRLVTDFSSLATVYNFDCSSGNKTFRASTTFASQSCTNSGSGGTAVTFQGLSGVVYINMGTRNLTLNTNAANLVFNIPTSTTPLILVINSTGDVTINASQNNSTVTIYGNIYSNSTGFVMLTESGGGTAATTMNGILFTSGEGRVRSGAALNGVFIASQADMRTQTSTATYTSSNITNTYNDYYGDALRPITSPAYGLVAGSLRDFTIN